MPSFRNTKALMTRREFEYAWGNNPRRAELKGKPCTIVAHGSRMYSVLVEFEDGQRVVTSRRALKKPKEQKNAV